MINMRGVIFREDTVQFELDQIKEHFDESLDSIKKQFLVAEKPLNIRPGSFSI